jgi:hypothetical protein
MPFLVSLVLILFMSFLWTTHEATKYEENTSNPYIINFTVIFGAISSMAYLSSVNRFSTIFHRHEKTHPELT